MVDNIIRTLINAIYPQEAGLAEKIMALIDKYAPAVKQQRTHFSPSDKPFSLSCNDVILITYGDSLYGREGTPLQYLHRFLNEPAEGLLSCVHVLPFSPYSSDDGFSIIDYRMVNPELGTWDDIQEIAGDYRFMADFVMNHCSVKSQWFQHFLQQKPSYEAFFITASPNDDLSAVARPRALPLLTAFETAKGTRHVWTTFSADQADLNWASPAVLLEMVDVFLDYLAKGAGLVRLDAVAYLWKEIGTSCLHHENTHRMVKLLRRIMQLVDAHAVLITETNVPHTENVSYFGSGDEAHMVYNFSLPPLLLDAMLQENTDNLTKWAASLEDPGETASYFNFCASHDGIGLLPTHGILSDEERDAMIAMVKKRGGRISYKATPKGDIPYEMNINYFSAVADPSLPKELKARAFLVTQAVMFSLAGVPGIYIHSLVGSQNWQEGVKKTGANRSINREKLNYHALLAELETRELRYLVFSGYKALLRARASSDAFDPKSEQRILHSDARLFVLLRYSSAGKAVLCIHNFYHEAVIFNYSSLQAMPHFIGEKRKTVKELISGDWITSVEDTMSIDAYGVYWLQLS